MSAAVKWFVFDNYDKKQPTVTTSDWPVYIRHHPPKERAADFLSDGRRRLYKGYLRYAIE